MPRVKLRPISFEKALAISDGKRFTCEHLPRWYQWAAKRNGVIAKYYAPQFRTDREWYDNTVFYGEPGHFGSEISYHSINYTWPMGIWLDKPYRIPGQRVRLDIPQSVKYERIHL